MNPKDNNAGESLTPRTDADDRAYPLPEYAQRIQFEGATHVVMSPEAYEALYDHARQLGCELQQAKVAHEAAQATIGELREALAPFAKYRFGANWGGHITLAYEPDVSVVHGYGDDGKETGVNVMYSDFVRAREVLARYSAPVAKEDEK